MVAMTLLLSVAVTVGAAGTSSALVAEPKVLPTLPSEIKSVMPIVGIFGPWGRAIALAAGGYSMFADAVNSGTLVIGGLNTPKPQQVEAMQPGTDSSSQAYGGQYCGFGPSGINWDVTTLIGTVVTPSLQVNGILAPINPKQTGGCSDTYPPGLTGNYTCWNPVTQAFYSYTHTPMRINGVQNSYNGFPCQRGASSDPIFSVRINGSGPTSFAGSTNQTFYNPKFDATVAASRVVLTVEKQCQNPSTNEVVTVSEQYQGVKVIPEVGCPEGWIPQKVEWKSTIGSQTSTLGGFSYDHQKYPDCVGGGCEFAVFIDGRPCRVGIAECYDWMQLEPKSRLKCEYGPYALGFADCAPMEFAYRTESGMVLEPEPQPGKAPRWVPAKPDGSPATELGPGTYWTPDPYPNPNYKPNEGWDPSKNPAPLPGLPTTGVNPNPNPGGSPLVDPETGKNCMSAAWSWNPVNWVLTPVKCAMVWAFVPKKEAVTGVQTKLRTSVDKSGASGWFQAGTGLVAIPDGGGCGVTVTFPLTNTQFHMLDSCTAPMSTVAVICKAFLTMVIVTLGVFHGTRAVAGAFGYQFSMGGKGSADGD